MKKNLFVYVLMAVTLFSCAEQDDLDVNESNASVNPEKESSEPKLIALSFSMYLNPMQLTGNVEGTIVGDSIVECWVPNIMSDKSLIADIEHTGDTLLIDGELATSGATKFDFKKPVTLTVIASGKAKDYTVYVHSFTGLPVLWIETEGRQDITSKDVYLNAHLRLVENVRTRAAGDVIEKDVTIKGRGNSTWGMAKKPYQLKFEEKTSLPDETADKTWVLLANYADKAMLRTSVAFYMGQISNLDYTPKAHFVELFLNGRYNGTYLLCEKLKIAKHRVNVGDDGFLLEVDAKAASDDITFKVSHLGQPVNIKDPDVVAGDEDYAFVSDYVSKADAALYSSNFTDVDTGWQKYMDMDSFVEWYLVNEIAKNNDACMFSSCYMNLKRGEKLKMGPLWDFDIAFGNVNYNGTYLTDGFWIKNSNWFSQMFKDPAFVARVKERFDYFYSRKDDIMREINENAEYLRYAVQENENKWHTFYVYTWPNYDIWGSYQNEVQSMKEWLNTRFEWLKTEFDKM